MVTMTLAINIPDDQLTRVRAAARAHWGQVIDNPGDPNANPPVPPTFRDMTNAEINERFRKSVVAMIKDMVKRTEEDAASDTAKAGVTPVDPT
jgi:hypothetical protein